jgi:two-component system chemotaxis response regulator CheB
MTVKVFIVDDSATVRTVLSMLLEKDPDIEVLGTAANVSIALRKMEKQWPDVIITDLEMPGMHGLDFIRHVMQTRPTPCVVCSSHVGHGAAAAVEALALGAVEIIAKPNVGLQSFLEEITQTMIASVKAAARAVVQQPHRRDGVAPVKAERREALQPVAVPRVAGRRPYAVIGIGSSTGGTTVVEHILKSLPLDAPGVIVVQHMPPYFTGLFARRLNDLCRITVKEAQDGDEVLPGTALIAPGGQQLALAGYPGHFRVRVYDGETVSGHRPSVNVLFRSIADIAGEKAVGIILTGMGDDGADGLLKMRQAGALTIGQDEATSAVFGMPKVAMNLGAVQYQLPYPEIPAFLQDAIHPDVK